jgi:hypothetical protein
MPTTVLECFCNLILRDKSQMYEQNVKCGSLIAVTSINVNSSTRNDEIMNEMQDRHMFCIWKSNLYIRIVRGLGYNIQHI